RMATVTSCVPDATIARSRASRLGAPPVPSMSLDAKVTPARTNGSPISASLRNDEHLNMVTNAQLDVRPRRAGNDLPVYRDCDSASISPKGLKEPDDGGGFGQVHGHPIY